MEPTSVEVVAHPLNPMGARHALDRCFQSVLETEYVHFVLSKDECVESCHRRAIWTLRDNFACGRCAMTHGRKPRQPRPSVANPIRLASWTAAKLNTQQQATIMAPVHQAYKALREGVATELQWAHLVSAMNIADGIAHTSPVRGTHGHILLAQLALDGIKDRAMCTGAWLATALHYQELDHLRDGIDIYQHQLAHISRGEYHSAEDYATAEVLSTGGVALNTNPASAQQLTFAGV